MTRQRQQQQKAHNCAQHEGGVRLQVPKSTKQRASDERWFLATTRPSNAREPPPHAENANVLHPPSARCQS